MSHRTQHLLPGIVSLFIGLCWSMGVCFGQVHAEDDVIEISAGKQVMIITFNDLLANDIAQAVPNLQLDTAPLHGTLNVANELFIYEPDDSFWDLGSDQFTYTLSGERGQRVATVVLVPEQLPLIHYDGFELSEFNQYSMFQGSGAVVAETEEAKINGSEGLLAANSGLSVSPAYIFYPIWAGGLGNGGEGDDDGDVGGAVVDIGMSNFSSLDLGETESVVLLSGCDDGSGWPRYRLRAWRNAATGTDSIQMAGEVLDTSGTEWEYVATSSMSVLADDAQAQLTYWRRDDNSAGIRLRLDGRLSNAARSHLVAGDCTEVRLGMMPTSPQVLSQGVALHFDDFRLAFDSAGPQHRPVATFWHEEFEAGNFDNWESVVRPNGFSFVTGDVLSGFKSLSVPVVGGEQHWLEGALPATEDRTASVRFTLDAADMLLPQGTLVKILDAGTPNLPPGTGSSLDLFMKPHVSGGMTLSTRWMEGVAQSQVVAVLSPGPHTIELQYRAASSEGNDNGFYRVWVDGQLEAEAPALMNFDHELSWVRLGVKTGHLTVSGVLRLDRFMAW